MECPQESNGPDETLSAPKKSKSPLSLRMYFQPHMTEVVRRIGYASFPIEEARARLQPLFETYGREVIVDAARELIIVDDSVSPAVAKLSNESRRLALQILGRPPLPGSERPGASTIPPAPVAQSTASPSPPPPRKRRSRAKAETAAESGNIPPPSTAGTQRPVEARPE